MKRVAVIVGTRPEAIKMAPVLQALSKSKSLKPITISSSQHRHLVHQIFRSFGIRADHDLQVMRTAQTAPRLLNRNRNLNPGLSPSRIGRNDCRERLRSGLGICSFVLPSHGNDFKGSRRSADTLVCSSMECSTRAFFASRRSICCGRGCPPRLLRSHLGRFGQLLHRSNQFVHSKGFPKKIHARMLRRSNHAQFVRRARDHHDGCLVAAGA